MTYGSLVVGEQFSASIRNIALLIILSRNSDPELTAALMVTFTSTQMVTSLGFATVGEPAMLAPKNWVAGRGFRRVTSGGMASAVFSFVATCSVGLFMGLSVPMAGAMAILAAVMSWADVERVLHLLSGRPFIPLVRNGIVVIMTILSGILNLQSSLAVAVLAITWLVSCLISRPAKPKIDNNFETNRWSNRGPAATGIIDIGVSYLVIQGTLFLTIGLFGASMAAPLRLAQSMLGPVQMMASGLRNVVTMRSQSHHAWSSKRIIWFIAPACAFVTMGMVLVIPGDLAQSFVGPQWVDILEIFPALVVQASLVSVGAIGAARLRLMGHYSYVSALRIASGVLSLAGAWSLARIWDGLDPGIILLGLSVGPTIAAPFWILGKRKKHEQ